MISLFKTYVIFSELSFKSNVTKMPMDEILSLLKQLGNLYPSNFVMEENRNKEVDQLLTTYYNGFYDVTNVMKNVRIQN